MVPDGHLVTFRPEELLPHGACADFFCACVCSSEMVHEFQVAPQARLTPVSVFLTTNSEHHENLMRSFLNSHQVLMMGGYEPPENIIRTLMRTTLEPVKNLMRSSLTPRAV